MEFSGARHISKNVYSLFDVNSLLLIADFPFENALVFLGTRVQIVIDGPFGVANFYMINK